MAHNVLITPEAENDLDGIYNYILNHFLAPQAAENTMSNIKLAITKIAEVPSLGIDVSERVGRQFSNEHPLKMMIAGNYLVFYVFDDTTVAILRVLYQKQNWVQLFK
ncbi:type II toxin-antitoxin system RelE/ParE family toxin [Streptococcus hyointestinalis]|uniref:type II toxin-antitoxin system RelE/ParE family toxin n=1 Tax=Streptococcus hyointestinalis TaxID=1337 RepID=UPI0013DEBFAB|nr:type II toxin-antitoxin system RelE/ParE family toxin [Streptococcus hyointestinalis]